MKSKSLKLILFYLLIVGIWEAITIIGIWPKYLFPSFIDVLKAVINGFSNYSFLIGILASMKRVIIGFSISIVVGMLIGLLIGRVKTLDDTVGTLVLGFQALPSICWLPLALLWFGLNESAIIMIVIMGSLFAITIGVDSGVKSVPPIYIKAARTMGARNIKLYTHVIIPAALPSIISGLKQGWSFAWRSLMAGELLYVSVGLGQLLMAGRELNNISQVVAVMVIIIFIGIAIDRLIFSKIENQVSERWGLRNNI